MVKKLVAREAVVTKEFTDTFPEGYTYVLLVDPDTGDVYNIRPGWEVRGENLETLFDKDESPSDATTVEWV